ncbi:mechanosensitive ion channel domain-containing protein [Aerosakkonema sp. BLCC-F183]|uniref:mechanosensitive ion channel domain-containing protein n=1 Tax=Aerosakkonema sp. BLCC-F183 TaxID=3342834 RepID=UPI0035BA025F
MEKSNLIWGLVLIVGFPILSITLGEGREYLAKRENPLENFFNNIRVFILPLLAIVLVMAQLLEFKATGLPLEIVETVLGFAAIYTILSLVNVVLTDGKKQQLWQIQVPSLLFQVTRISVVLGVLAYLLADVWQVDLSQVFAALGVGSLVIALALQDTLSNLVSGFLLIFESPFKIGDWIKVDEQEGEVLEINWRAVRLKTRERDVVIIPNGVLGQNIIYNYTLLDPLHADRVVLNFSNQEPPNRVKQILLEAVLSVEGVMSHPEPEIRPIKFSEVMAEYEVEYYIAKFARSEEIRGQFMTNVYYAAKRNNLDSPIPAQKHYLLTRKDLQSHDDSHEIAETLLSLSSFSFLERETVTQLAQGATLKYYGVREQIVREGNFDTGLYIIVNGGVTLSVTDVNKQKQEIARLSTGEFFGENVLLRGEPSPVSVTVTNDLKAILIQGDAVFDLAQRYPRFASEMNRFIEERKKLARLGQGKTEIPSNELVLTGNGRQG